MRTNDTYSAKRLTDPAQWQRIDDWMAHNQVKECIAFHGEHSIGHQIANTHWKFSQYGQCESESGKFYEFSIDDIEAKKVGWGWLIINWGEIKEGQF